MRKSRSTVARVSTITLAVAAWMLFVSAIPSTRFFASALVPCQRIMTGPASSPVGATSTSADRRRQRRNKSRSALPANRQPFASGSIGSDNNNNNNNNKKQPKIASTTQTVAVIGGGIAGLTCAQHLAASAGRTGDTRFQPTVFDTGRLRPGGRCSSRQPGDPESSDRSLDYKYLHAGVVDHAAQILTVPNNNEGNSFREFQSQVDQWEAQGIVTKYPENSVCNIIKAKNSFALKPINTPEKPPMYYGTNGMGSIPGAIQQESQATLRQDVWVAPSNGVRYQKETQKWKLQAKGKTLGIFDHLVIAHNGKCADRIMSQSPAKDVHRLLRVNFAPRVAESGGQKMTLNSIYSLTFCVDASKTLPLEQALPPDQFICGFVQNEPILKFLTCHSRKYPSDSNDTIQVWTVLSSAPFAKKYKAPQEFLPEDVVQNVTSLLLQGIERSLDLPLDYSLEEDVLESRLQLWGAAVPVNVWDSSSGQQQEGGFLHDPKFGVGVCGDWLLDPSIAGAWESGRRLAEHMKENASKHSKPVGLEGSFRASHAAMKAGIGSL